MEVYKATKNSNDVKIKLDLPIGTIYENKFNINISDYFMGVWERYGNGQVLVGVDENDVDFNSSDISIGEKNHTLTIDEMPTHNHLMPTVPVSNASYSNYVRQNNNVEVYWGDGNDFTKDKGGNQSHNNIQPSRTIYRWIRIS